jgi:DNA replication protein DnaC
VQDVSIRRVPVAQEDTYAYSLSEIKAMLAVLDELARTIVLTAALTGLRKSGVGKSYVASALAQKACRDGYRVYYTRAAALFRDLSLARADGSLRQLLRRLNRIDVLVVDDWVMAPMSEAERRDFWEIAEERYQTRSMVLTSQLPVSRWHEQIGDPTLADGILDRIVHNAHRIEMRVNSMRKKKCKNQRRFAPRTDLIIPEH